MKILDCVQGSSVWFDARIGHLTSSRIKDAISKRKRNPTEDLACRVDLRLDLAVERVTRKPMEHFVSRWMEEGKEKEPLARAAYEIYQETETKEVGFVFHPDIAFAGCSPDGLVGEDGLVEFKAPKSNTHAEYLLGERVPELYIPQMMWQMACTGRQFCDFASYHPDFPEGLDLFVCRLPRDEAQIEMMETEAVKFLAQVETMVAQLKGGIKEVLRMSLVPRAVIPGA